MGAMASQIIASSNIALEDQTTAQQPSGTTQDVTLNALPNVGDLIVISTQGYLTADGVDNTTVAGFGVTTWNAFHQAVNGTTIFAFSNIAWGWVDGTPSVDGTVDIEDNSNYSTLASRYSGIPNDAITSNSPDPTNITGTSASLDFTGLTDTYLMVVSASEDSSIFPTPPGSPWTNLDQVGTSPDDQLNQTAYYIQPGAGAQSPTYTRPVSDHFYLIGVQFDPSAVVPADRLFADNSPWNTVKTQGTFSDAADGALQANTYGLNNDAFSHPIYTAQESDDIGTFDCPESWGKPATLLKVQCPSDITPASGSDGVASLIALDGNLYDFYQLTGTWPNFSCTAWNYGPANGSGWGEQGTWINPGTTGAGCSQAAGTIREIDIQSGKIPHAVCISFAYNYCGGVGTSGTPFVPPAAHYDDDDGGPLMEGGNLLIPTGTAMPDGLSDGDKMLWECLSTLGAYITDVTDGWAMFYGDRSDTVGNAFTADGLVACGQALRLAVTWEDTGA